MDRTTAVNHIVNDGKRQFTSDGESKTILESAHFNAVQEELLSVIYDAGLVPSANDFTQLQQAIQNYLGILPLRYGDQSSPDYDTLKTGIDAGTIYTVGPTGSGADVIWPQMDNIPAAAKWIRFITQTYSDANADVHAYFYYNDANNYVYGHVHNHYNAAVAHQHLAHDWHLIPLDTDLKFKLHYFAPVSSGNLKAQLVGYVL